jgi:hypothetical protein
VGVEPTWNSFAGCRLAVRLSAQTVGKLPRECMPDLREVPYSAEGTGFEPVGLSTSRLAGERIKPLCQPSKTADALTY